jgi:solute carrier family 10 (sodium/bile acid cotransporter), member 7
MMFLRRNWFLLGLITLTTYGLLLPEAGLAAGLSGRTASLLIAAIFFVTGLTLPTQALLTGIRDLRLHLTIQLFIFGAVPLYFLSALTLLPLNFSPEIRIGIYALAVLPTTISSCAVLTQTADGNTAASLFNAVTANLLGIVISPLLLSLMVKGAGVQPVGRGALDVVQTIGVTIVVPLAAGQALHLLRPPPEPLLRRLKGTVSVLLLGLIWIFVSQSAADERFREQLPHMGSPFAFLALSFLVLTGLSFAAARLLRFSQANVTAVIFTAPQKTLAMGIPLLSAFFSDSPQLLGTALLPLLFYHPWQLLVSGLLSALIHRSQIRNA